MFNDITILRMAGGIARRLGTPPPGTNNRLRAAQVEALFQTVFFGAFGAVGGAVILAASLVHLGELNWIVGVAWAGDIGVGACGHILLRFAYRRAKPAEDHWRPWGIAFTAISLYQGMGWGWAATSLVSHDHFDLEMLLVVVTQTIAAGAVPAYGSYLPAFLALYLPSTVPSLLWSFTAGQFIPAANVMFGLTLLYIPAMGLLGVRANRSFKELVELRIRADGLAKDLHEQKDVAERANLAKSTFLAAASHDLRQPVHALGLFVGALRGVALPPEGSRLVEQIDTSVVAMDGLFSALLDISRLDAGIVEVHRQSFAIQPLLERICRDYAGEAEAKSISIVQHPCTATVFTDPVLMERILRNLVSNAIRYTDRGRVVVGGRRSGGRIRIQILDTGRGIPLAQQERVFEEYFQLGNPERDRTKGLGLGLAIVRRLTRLLDCELTLRSELGRGSSFSVDAPLASGGVDYAEPPEENFATMPAPGLVLVIDDEAAIRDAMSSLLKGWGYEVVTAGSGDDMLAELAHSMHRPTLIICDYRLRAGEIGIEVIERLRSEYNDAIPAMLITGDTARDRLAEAQASGLLLLHKPVSNSKLRAAIANLIAASGADDGAEEVQISSVK
ncbi:hybrid sensor histidine kinase/response regulator [Methylocapsa sp. S129]|uniref:ATP-binding response regulator n=1 Tax=Methylocapsa sp. S129 TaxID=1641869 RepID=UPI00131C351F|nr:hybrid sensor histidine kinase/response regulator [Methylocapsa sp. S129]